MIALKPRDQHVQDPRPITSWDRDQDQTVVSRPHIPAYFWL